MENPNESGGNTTETQTGGEQANNNVEYQKLVEKVDKNEGMLTKIYNKFFDKEADKESPIVKKETPVSNPNKEKDKTDYAKLYAKNLELEKEKEKLLQEKAEKQAQEERAAEIRKIEVINKELQSLIDNGVIAAGNTAQVDRWRRKFETLFEDAKVEAAELIGAKNNSNNSSGKSGVKALTEDKKLLAFQQASKYIATGDIKSFE